jgi:hypothetical protein
MGERSVIERGIRLGMIVAYEEERFRFYFASKPGESVYSLADIPAAGTKSEVPSIDSQSVPPATNQQVPNRESQRLHDEQSAALDDVEREIKALWDANPPAVFEMMGRLYTINRRIQKIQEGDKTFDDLVTRG